MGELDLDTDKLDDVALAILSLTLHDRNRVWKGLDWSITLKVFISYVIATTTAFLHKATNMRLRLSG